MQCVCVCIRAYELVIVLNTPHGYVQNIKTNHCFFVICSIFFERSADVLKSSDCCFTFCKFFSSLVIHSNHKGLKAQSITLPASSRFFFHVPHLNHKLPYCFQRCFFYSLCTQKVENDCLQKIQTCYKKAKIQSTRSQCNVTHLLAFSRSTTLSDVYRPVRFICKAFVVALW